MKVIGDTAFYTADWAIHADVTGNREEFYCIILDDSQIFHGVSFHSG